MNHRLHVKTAFLRHTASEVLQSPPSVLLGVTPEAEAVLADLQVKTVYDLALSTVFANAARVVAAASDPEAVINKHGKAPADVIDQSAAATPVADLPAAPITALVGIGPVNGPAVSAALDVKSIRDFAHWPPYMAAKNVLVAALSPERAIGYDAEAPAELLPRAGRHATQRVNYTTAVLIKSHAAKDRMWNGKLMNTSVLDSVGFERPAFGAVLGFSQSWKPAAVALGQLLHSLPLAPGESTKLTMMDWVRRSTARTTEEVEQTDMLSSTMDQSTAISEVTSAVAKEVQEGSSTSGATSASTSAGGIGFIPSFGFAGGGASMNASGAATYSVSSGTRTTAAEASQHISSRTRQNSALSRNKRAAVVSEISDSESERISTRSVSNNNHMHSLSIQYYEVVQLYETEVRLERVERCLFIPMKLIDFRQESNIRRYLNVLARRALDGELRRMLLSYRSTVDAEFGIPRFADGEIERIADTLAQQDFLDNARGGGPGTFPLPDAVEKQIIFNILRQRVRALKATLRTNYATARAKRLINSYAGDGYSRISIPAAVTIAGASWDAGETIDRVELHLKDGDVMVLENAELTSAPASGLLNPGISVNRIDSIVVRLVDPTTANPSDFGISSLRLRLERGDKYHWLDASFVTSRGGGQSVTLMNFNSPVDVQTIADRLMEDQLYYSQQVWLRADRHSLLMQLYPYELHFDNGDAIRVVDYIDASPVTVAGNYVAFRFTYEADEEWRVWRDKQWQETLPLVDVVPMATGGVFAEAVLGEFNSAEKLDATRFWRWEDSKIPYTASEIAPAEAGLNRPFAAGTPRALPEAGITLQNLPALPALANSEQILRAVVANTIFRDMGGLEITSKLMAASIEAARRGDEAAAKQARDTAKAVFAAADSVVKSVVAGGGQMVKTATELGGLLNSVATPAANLASGGATQIVGAVAGGSGSGAAGGAAGAGGVAAIAEQIGPIVAQLAPMLLAL